MPAARGVKRTASKASASTAASSAPKNKKKRGVIQLEIPKLPGKRGRVLTCGQGFVGQLGLGEDVSETAKFKHVTVLGDKIVDACAGGMHTVVLDCDGKVWTFGCNDEGALGRPTSEDSEEGAPTRVSLPSKAVALSAGDSHTAALLDDGRVYAWGAFRDSHGSMGLMMQGREGKARREPTHIDIGEPCAAIASGGDHLVMLTISGSVFTMGCGEQGQLGRLSQRSATRDTRQGFSALLIPSKVTLKGGASQVWAGSHATFALDASGEKMFAWGLNNYGQLGIPGDKRKGAIFSPTECSVFNQHAVGWSQVVCGQHHTLALDASGTVHALGRSEYGRLGLGNREGDAEILEPIPQLATKKCVSIAAGTSSSFATTTDFEVYAWGMGSEGQLGIGDSIDKNEPTLVNEKARLVAAGGQHTVLLTEEPLQNLTKSPTPEKEPAVEKIEVTEKEVKPRPTKRQKNQEVEDEVSSTSTAADVAEGDKPQKVNGKDKKETPMEVDETDNAHEETDKKTPEEAPKTEEKPKEEATPATETEKPEKEEKEPAPVPEATPQPAPQPETDTKKEEIATNDVEMKEESSEPVNGTPEIEEPKVVAEKTVPEEVIPSEALASA